MTTKKRFPQTQSGLGDWYDIHIEEPVKKIVWALRNHGVNTESSCGHEMYIQCFAYDPTQVLDNIYNAMRSLGIKDYEVKYHRAVTDGYIQESINIWIPKNENKELRDDE